MVKKLRCTPTVHGTEPHLPTLQPAEERGHHLAQLWETAFTLHCRLVSQERVVSKQMGARHWKKQRVERGYRTRGMEDFRR